MKGDPHSLDRRNSALIGAVLAVTLGLASWWAVKGLAHLSYDLLFLLRPKVRIDGVALVYMDDTSAKKFDQGLFARWDRGLHAKLIERLVAGHARAIVFDILFDSSSTNDAPLFAAVVAAQRAGIPILLAARTERRGRQATKAAQVQRPFPALENLAPWGLVVGEDSTDHIVRHHIQESSNWPSLASRTAELMSAPTIRHGAAPKWLNYYGPPGTLLDYRYHEVLDPAFNPAPFSNQVVFVGGLADIPYMGGKETDEWPTPWSHAGYRKAPGTEVTATACTNFMRGDWLVRWPDWAEIIGILGVGFLGGFGLVICRPTHSVRLAAAAGFAILGVALGSMWQGQVWFAWLIPAAVQLPAALGWAVLTQTRRLQRQNEMFARELAVLEPVRDFVGAHTVSDPATKKMSLTVPNENNSPSLSADEKQVPALTINKAVVPDHTLLRCIGQGGYGEVWLARNAIGTYHAVKLVHRSAFRGQEPFERECRGIQRFMPISRLHPGLVQMLHVGRNDATGCLYYVMEPGDDEVNGQEIEPESYSPKNLAREIKRRGALAGAECIRLGLALSSALEFLHAQHLIHRDIKPSNIIFVRGQPKFTDIGLVTAIATTKTGVSYLGTEGYIAPEGPGHPPADIFSLGRVLYEAWTGLACAQYPALPDSLLQRPDRHLLQELNKVILKACHPELAHRYGSAAQMEQELKRLDP